MLYSAEIHWFLEGAIGADVVEWFCSRSLADIGIESRSDRYLVFPGCESVGVKLREPDDPENGRFEIKAAVGAAEVLSPSVDLAGRAESWSKWTFKIKGFDAWVLAITGGNDTATTWIDAGKQRRLRKFSLDTGEVIEVGLDERPLAGCSVELVELHVDSELWWAFGFESFGARFDVRTHLRRVLAHWIDTRGVVRPFRVCESVAYPTWAGGFVTL